MLLPKILIIDDEKAFIDPLFKVLKDNHFTVKGCLACEEALRLLNHEFFDVVICDVRLPFYGIPDGGLEMAKEIADRSPASFSIIVSQYVTDKLVNAFMESVKHKKYCFLTKDKRFTEKLLNQINKILVKKTIFVCMPFHEAFENIYELVIKEVAKELTLRCERADEIQHNGGILEKVFESIKSAHIIVAEMTSRNPNVFYEVGYAHALRKEVILITQHIDSIPVDLRGFNHIEYNPIRLRDLQKALKKRIEAFFQ